MQHIHILLCSLRGLQYCPSQALDIPRVLVIIVDAVRISACA